MGWRGLGQLPTSLTVYARKLECAFYRPPASERNLAASRSEASPAGAALPLKATQRSAVILDPTAWTYRNSAFADVSVAGGLIRNLPVSTERR